MNHSSFISASQDCSAWLPAVAHFGMGRLFGTVLSQMKSVSSVSIHAVKVSVIMGTEDFLINGAYDAELVIDVLELGDSVANPHSSFQSLVHNLVFLHPCDRR